MSSPALSAPGDDAVPSHADAALAELMARHEGPLYNFLVVLVGDRNAARDCVQDTFLRAFEHLSKGRSVNKQWLYRVGRNRGMDHFRRLRKMRYEPLADHEGMESESGEIHACASVNEALAALLPQDRELLYLAHVDRFKAREIAAMIGAGEGAVRMRLLRAHRRFRAAYRGDL